MMPITPGSERAARINLVAPGGAGDARAIISPLRGALCLGWEVGGRPLLYLDPATLEDPTKNVRGGVPVLFPSPGKLAGGRFAQAGQAAGGKTAAMGQHGFARSLPWSVVARSADQLTLRLESTPETLLQYPFEFAVALRFALAGASLFIDQRVENPGRQTLPFAFGFHPYFAVPVADKARARIDTTATRAFDNVAQKEIALSAGPIDLGAGEVDLHLLDHGRSDAALVLPDGGRVELIGSPEYRRWVVWTLPGRDFLCLEPWTAPADALNSGQDLLHVPAGAERALSLELRWLAP
jgi:galactose mutarotase-like enzyme